MACFGGLALRLGFAVAASLVAAAAPAAAALQNGGFDDPAGPFTGWEAVGNISPDDVFYNTGNWDAAFADPLGTSPPSTLSQTVSTDPGASYLLSFALLDESGLSVDTFTVSFGGFTQTLTGDQAAPPGTTPAFYTDFSFIIPGSAVTGAATALTFSGQVDPTNETEWNLDDVSLVEQSVPVPEAPSGMILVTSVLMAWTLRRRRRTGANDADVSSHLTASCAGPDNAHSFLVLRRPAAGRLSRTAGG
jgi:hypothetical protein